MSQFQINPDFIIEDETALRGLFEPTHTLAALKSLYHLDQHARDFITRAPFLCIGTQNAEGRADVSPRGDPAGFVRMLDDRTLAIPDRPGNNRLDTLANILATPSVGLLFLIPGFDETLRINGRALLSIDPAILEPMAVNGRTPKLAIVVQVAEVFIHCAKALRRSRLWDPAALQDRKAMPSLMQMLLDQTGKAAEEPMDKVDAGLEEEYRRTMY
ncbi:pyridoxamine 5'-phosphate oxidase family protein [Neogemmobacter tilapiae]|uniref:Pyridoxamine 5'-phosphate oxidase N-terminal domain-containing protein n=1 Tax=Neogemmobacter tilapiae TaxID=875041 RepID=A0A918TTI7_9RHOB|nr:pyridoxamine 5'-phosphate oxidase family protein [Gemmobacter tilapiae]GHC62920.1 hypothetical protein GCM10007315_28920 [Gemmobacter tilapiae]